MNGTYALITLYKAAVCKTEKYLDLLKLDVGHLRSRLLDVETYLLLMNSG